MSAASDVFAALGGTAGLGAMLYVSVPHAIKAWRGTKRDAADVAKVEAREDTAQRRIDDEAARRHETRDAKLHDECREEVRQVREELRTERDARLELTESVARCEEKHRASEARERERDERLARLERRSNPPVTASPEPAE